MSSNCGGRGSQSTWREQVNSQKDPNELVDSNPGPHCCEMTALNTTRCFRLAPTSSNKTMLDAVQNPSIILRHHVDILSTSSLSGALMSGLMFCLCLIRRHTCKQRDDCHTFCGGWLSCYSTDT